jgi:hypothetical protein
MGDTQSGDLWKPFLRPTADQVSARERRAVHPTRPFWKGN